MGKKLTSQELAKLFLKDLQEVESLIMGSMEKSIEEFDRTGPEIENVMMFWAIFEEQAYSSWEKPMQKKFENALADNHDLMQTYSEWIKQSDNQFYELTNTQSFHNEQNILVEYSQTYTVDNLASIATLQVAYGDLLSATCIDPDPGKANIDRITKFVIEVSKLRDKVVVEDLLTPTDQKLQTAAGKYFRDIEEAKKKGFSFQINRDPSLN